MQKVLKHLILYKIQQQQLTNKQLDTVCLHLIPLALSLVTVYAMCTLHVFYMLCV
jgi:hypothetical protein